MYYTLSALTGYLIGSVPFAYILLKKARSVDITREGTGNVGAMNAYEVTNSRQLGILVLLLDMLKGLLSCYICILLFPVNFIYPALALFFAVLSHCFNPWLEFKGGRGLATATGGSILIFPFLFALWIILWAATYLIKRDIHIANISATVLSLFAAYFTTDLSMKYAFPRPDASSTLIMFSTGILVLIFIRHIEPLKDLLKKQTS